MSKIDLFCNVFLENIRHSKWVQKELRNITEKRGLSLLLSLRFSDVFYRVQIHASDIFCCIHSLLSQNSGNQKTNLSPK